MSYVSRPKVSIVRHNEIMLVYGAVTGEAQRTCAFISSKNLHEVSVHFCLRDAIGSIPLFQKRQVALLECVQCDDFMGVARTFMGNSMC